MELTGLHHLTAITAYARGNLAFYTQVLGMRLVKKTVNQDDVSAYHLFYADADASPGSDVTFFDWAQIGGYVAGVGEVSETGLRIASANSLDWWVEWLDRNDVRHGAIGARDGRPVLEVLDPEGQRLLIAVDEGGNGNPWAGGPVPVEHGILGLDSVRLTVRRAEATAALLTDVMEMREVSRYEREGNPVVVYAMGPGGPGAEVHLEEQRAGARAVQGAGGVHHVAFRTPSDAEHMAWLARLRAAGVPTSERIDRFYFRSLYFREPNGILFEIATDGPGFAVDEDAAHLGERLALPPFLEPQRARIETGLKPLEP